MTAPAGSDLAARIVAFVGDLRAKGVPAGTSETVDAAEVARVLGLQDRTRLREGLASALVRRGGQREVFDLLFDLHFPAGTGAPTAALGTDLDRDELRRRLTEALATHDTEALRALARAAVELLGDMGPLRAAHNGWSAHQTLDRLRPETLVAAASDLAGAGPAGGAGGGSHGSGGSGHHGSGGQDVAERLTRDEIRREVTRFRRLVEAEARRRTAELRGREVIVRHAVGQSADRIEFLAANQRQLQQLRATIDPLARRLATRISARRRQSHRGAIDVRRTLRRAMATGGVPMRPVHAPPRPAKPELVLLCDMSGSVAGFSHFTMLLVQALSGQFSKLRVFAFVNTVDEVTAQVRRGGEDLQRHIRDTATLTTHHLSSDYGSTFADFCHSFLSAVGPRTTVLILGDGRTNHGDPGLGALHTIAARSRRTFWLNPERATSWGVGDSAAPAYAEIVEMHECSTAAQLERFVSRLLPV